METLMLLLMMLVLLYSPRSAMNAAAQALKTWGLDVVPSLFPYMVLCQSLSAQLRRFPSLSVLSSPILGLLGGSPSGSAALSQSILPLKSFSGKRLLCLCTLTGTISPLFFLGPVSVWFQSEAAGRQLLIAHFSGAILSCIVVHFFLPASSVHLNCETHTSFDEEIHPIRRSVDSILNVGGCIVFYSVAANTLRVLLPFPAESLSAFVHGILEVSGGIRSISQCILPETSRLLLCAAVSGFSGFSILSQNLIFLRPLGVRMHHLAYLGLLRAFFCVFSMLVIRL